jgi:mannose-6-phosphate isomerase-like protein (cupin superfamily)
MRQRPSLSPPGMKLDNPHESREPFRMDSRGEQHRVWAVDDEAAELTEFWSQRVLAEANDNLLKVAKGVGSTHWHSHDDQDEVFLVTAGRLVIELRSGEVQLSAGDLFVVARGVEHRPRADDEVRFLIIGRSVTSNEAGGKPDWSANADGPSE